MSTFVQVRVRFTALNRRAWITVLFFTVGLAVAVLAQEQIYDSGEWFTGAIAYVIAFALLIAAWQRNDSTLTIPIREPLLLAQEPTALASRSFFILPCFLFAVITFVAVSGNRFTLVGVGAWIASLVCFVYALWEGSLSDAVQQAAARIHTLLKWDEEGRHARLIALALIAITVVGVYFYFYRLSSVPPEMTSDHAEKLLDTYDILHGKYSVFFERNTGREPLQFYLNALVVLLHIAPLDMLALQVVGATAGILTIPAVYLLGREFFDEGVGLFGAFFFASSIFPVAIARIGLRYPLAPLFGAWTLFFLVRGLRERHRNDFLMAGLMMGLGLNGYSPFRVVPILAGLWIVVWVLLKIRERFREIPALLENASMMFIGAMLVFVPLLRYITEHPENFFYRMATRMTSLEQPVQGDIVSTFIDNNIRALGMFNLQGDVEWVNSLPNVPAVDYIIGACLAIGVVYGLYRLVRYREYPFALMLVAVIILLLPSTLSFAFPGENPSVVRTGGIAPFVMILAALPLEMLRRQFALLDSTVLGSIVIGLVLVGVIGINTNLYFDRYEQEYREASWNSTEIAATLGEFAKEHNDYSHLYVMSEPYWVDYRAVGIHLGLFYWQDHLVENDKQLREQAKDPAAKAYALNDKDMQTLQFLQSLYPGGTSRHIDSRTPGRDFVVFYAPARN